MSPLRTTSVVLGFSCALCFADTHYVDITSTNATPPYTNWATAATAIQDSVDAASPGDRVLVGDGVYAAGGRAVHGIMTNRVALTNAVRLLSLHGPDVTRIEGRGPLGDRAVRCVYVGAGSLLSGFCLTNGHTRAAGDYQTERCGGGAWCESGGSVSNCTFAGNTAVQGGGAYGYGGSLTRCTFAGNLAVDGGGVAFSTAVNCLLMNNGATGRGGASYHGRLRGCAMTGNSAVSGGGAYNSFLNNCTVTGNTADQGGGSYISHAGSLANCIVWDNAAAVDANWHKGSLSYCCSKPLPPGDGNIMAAPNLSGHAHLSAGSPCIGAGSTALAMGTDIDGEAWVDPPSMGCDELVPGAVTGPLAVAIETRYNTMAEGFEAEFNAWVDGRTTGSYWSFGDGSVVSNRPAVTHVWSGVGRYDVVFTAFNESQSDGVSATVTVTVVTQPMHYVDVAGINPVPPFVSWQTAATSIQEAIDQADIPGALVLVAEGTYESGGRMASDGTVARVILHQPVIVCSANGPDTTTIKGAGPIGSAAVRGAYVGRRATLVGFTVTNGHTQSWGQGGGVRCAPGGEVRNCTIVGNTAHGDGGGGRGGRFVNCTLAGNDAFSDAGGGLYAAVGVNCRLYGNVVDNVGGGAYGSSLYNCVVRGNSAEQYGGGAAGSALYNCTLTGNNANKGGGGVGQCAVINSIVWYNSATLDANWLDAQFSYSCTVPPPPGPGNISMDPLLASASHLSASSPCVGQGSEVYATGSDIDGDPWSDPPSMGCDEVTADPANGALTVAIEGEANIAVGALLRLVGCIDGETSGSRWTFGDGTAVGNRPYVAYAWSSPGVYTVVLTAFNQTHPAGVSASSSVSVVEAPVHYVNRDGTNPVPPFASWAAAATNIQNAIDQAGIAGSLVLVTNGVYSGPAKYAHGNTTKNRIVVDQQLTVRSVNGPDVTVIEGSGPVGDNAVRCAYLGQHAVLEGFALTNGHTRAVGGDDGSGGGVWCAAGSMVSNCHLVGNVARFAGGGAMGGTLLDCRLVLNAAQPSGGVGGGGCYRSNLERCVLSRNSALSGGGCRNSVLRNCLLVDNMADYGGGSSDGTLYNCTLAGNVAAQGGGSFLSTLRHCVAYYNTATTAYDNVYLADGYRCDYSCTTPLPPGTNNITAVPRFRDADAGDYRLSAFSPCVDAGVSEDWMSGAIDLEANPRLFNGAVDMGAYEFTMNSRADCLLRGAWIPGAGRMNTHLFSAEFLPTNAPYAADVRTASAIPSSAADWMLLELRKTNDMSVVASKSALLTAEGKMLNADGGEDIRLECSPGHYYLVTKHRNHLAAMSAHPIAYTNPIVSYDFTTGPDKYMGGTNACVELEPGAWGMVAGDCDGDGKITRVDGRIVQDQIGMTGYLSGDLNLDGVVTDQDLP